MKQSHILQATVLVIVFSFTPGFATADHHGEQKTEQQTQSLSMVLDSQTDEAKARYQYRHPQQTLEFFGIKPGMKVAEALPGGGWYTKILLPYLGADGHLIGVDYTLDMWAHFGGFADAKFLEDRKTWATTWTENAQAWRGESGSSVSATTFETLSSETASSLDAVLFIRAMHNLARFEDKGGYFTDAIEKSFAALKSGGILGVVQHHARDNRPDEWADGSNGYLKKGLIIEAMQNAGFEYAGESDINANTKDQAGEGDFVWRLPPTLDGSQEKPELNKKMLGIGESNRMTLKFLKP